MAELKQFRLPDAGEGLTEAEIVTWRVAAGRHGDGQPDRSSRSRRRSRWSSCRSPFAGLVVELLAAEGETVDVGTPIIIDRRTSHPDAAAAAAEPAAGAERASRCRRRTSRRSEGAVEPGLIGGVAPGGRTSVLVGYGPRSGSTKRRQRVRRDEPAGSAEPAASLEQAEPAARRAGARGAARHGQGAGQAAGAAAGP